MLSILDTFAQSVDQTENIDNFYDFVWNILTAQGYGLDVWGRIVGVERVLAIAPTKYLGFAEATTLSADPYNQSPMYTGEVLTANYALTDPAYRQLILAKAAANIWDGSILGINAILRMLFPGQIAYCTDGQDMTMTYYFAFILNPVQVAIAVASGVLPRPAGVSASYVQV